jgi:hypothetical protein
MRAALLACVAGAANGCWYARLGADPPGHVDLAKPPAALAARGVTLPEPAWSPTLAISPGVLAGLGAHAAAAGSTRAETGLGFELGLYGTATKRGEVSIPGKRDWDLADHAVGVNLGWTPSQTRTAGAGPHAPTAYLEAQWRYQLAGVAAGVAASPGAAGGAHPGVQVTPLWGPFYLRALWQPSGGGVTVEAGVAIKVPGLLAFGG